MKYIKKFENNDKLYRVGDYVVIKPEYFKNELPRYVQIKNIDNTLSVNGYNTITDSGSILWILHKMIDRTMISKEIESYEIKKNTNKYNL